MSKYKMPTVQQFLQKKTIYGQKKDPVWIYLEKEMLQNIDKKPYNEKVGHWLKFLRDLKHFYYCEAQRKLKRLTIEIGPSWYCELSSCQREVLNHLKDNIHQDLLEDLPKRMRNSLSDLGVTLMVPNRVLLKAMNESAGDAGVFIWNLYTAYYKKPPSELRESMAVLPTGYIAINGGTAEYGGTYITILNGSWKYPRESQEKCDDTCDCLNRWEDTVAAYIKKSKCKCGHLYDFYNQGPLKEKYFYPPKKHSAFWIDYAKVYQMDPTEDFIKDTCREALMSNEPTALLADLAETPLLIPHLPQANLLNNLQEWVRKRVKGKILPKQHKQLLLQSERRWLDLKHMDFRARAYRIPFTEKQLEHFDWSHRRLVQKLFNILLEDFVTRNRVKQLEQTRFWWSTMKYDPYPSKAFLDIYYTYMPGRMKDTFLINPYSSERTPKYGAKTCPL